MKKVPATVKRIFCIVGIVLIAAVFVCNVFVVSPQVNERAPMYLFRDLQFLVMDFIPMTLGYTACILICIAALLFTPYRAEKQWAHKTRK